MYVVTAIAAMSAGVGLTYGHLPIQNNKNGQVHSDTSIIGCAYTFRNPQPHLPAAEPPTPGR